MASYDDYDVEGQMEPTGSPEHPANSLEDADWEELNDQMAARRKKREELLAAGIPPYGGRFPRTHAIQEVRDRFDELEGGEPVRIAGRIMALRDHGRVAFADIQDESGRIQLFFRLMELPEETYEQLYKRLDLGDIIGVEGPAVRTRRGELSVQPLNMWMLAKALRPLPEKWHGLKDVELRYRRRYLDLIVNPGVRQVFVQRSRAISAIRRFLEDQGYLEVETPMLHPIPGGAAARPFKTHHNALGIDLYLRIAPELYLKRLLVGGFEKVFEIGKNFRNEGISTRHNPEFTALEVYKAYADADDLMELTEQLIAYTAEQVLGTTKIHYQGRDIDLTPPWPRLPMLEAIRRYGGPDLEGVSDPEEARDRARRAGVEVEDAATLGDVINEVFEAVAEPHLIDPVFIVDFPVEVSPLAKRIPDRPAFTDRFEPYIMGWEVGNGFSELNDPIDQRLRFEDQAARREAGDEEAQMFDHDFLEALEYGMPPAGGLGIGIDRLVMLLTDSPSIRDVLLFPHLRPRTR